MASIEIDVAGRKYVVACRDGEETHLHAAAALVDQRARDAAAALGTMGEGRQLLFAALLLADDVKVARAGRGGPVAPEPAPGVAEAIEAVAERLEALAERIEARAGLEDRAQRP
jgi:cell division protein ZapA